MATYRSLDAALGQWQQVDIAAEKYYGLTPYNSMGNNPISFTDPQGDDFGLTALIGIGAATGIFSNGLSNGSNGQGFFDGALGAAAWGGVSAAASFGIGSAAGGLFREGLSLGKAAFQVGAHGLSSGLQSELSGGSFGQGLLAGGISSGLSSGASALSFGDAAMIGVGGLGGGIGSAIGGGNFFDGFGQGIAVGAFNHALQHIATIRSTRQAWRHYKRGKGADAKLHKDIRKALLNNKKFKAKLNKILSRNTTSLQGNFGVDLTGDFFHVGNTNVEYLISSLGNGNINVTFDLFVNDGFWDVDFVDEYFGIQKPDGLGPNLERFGGTPYQYIPQQATWTISDPGYFGN